MKKEKISAEGLKLRRHAEKALEDTPDGHDDLSGMSSEDKTFLIHELRVHQIELKMQNEELRRIQGELERTRDRYSHLYDFAPIGYFTGTEKGIITEANLTIASMLESERSALIGKPFANFILKDDQDIYYKHRRRLMETEAPQICELRLVKNDEREFYARLECIAFNSEGGDLKQIRAVVSDITEQKNLENQLRQAHKLKAIGTLAGGIAHDFNNILAAIIGFAELALDDAEKETDLADNLEEVLIGGKRAKLLVEQILTFSRKAPQKLVPLRMGALVKETSRLLRSTIPANIEIDVEVISTVDPCVMGDETQICQIILNLCTNAAYAMEAEGGKMTISIDAITIGDGKAGNVSNLPPGNYVKLSVKDTGQGILHENIERIFEPYFSTKESHRGTGMGLAVVEGIVTAHKGKILVISQPQKGSIFNVFLPMLENIEVTPGGISQDVLPVGKEHIFVIDDEIPIVKLNRLTLEKLGYTVTTSTSSHQALEAFRVAPGMFDLVITDMTMPDMTGDQLAAELIKIRSDIPVILSTGYSKNISYEKAVKIGIRAFVYKPIVKADLAETVRKVLDEAKAKG